MCTGFFIRCVQSIRSSMIRLRVKMLWWFCCLKVMAFLESHIFHRIMRRMECHISASSWLGRRQSQRLSMELGGDTWKSYRRDSKEHNSVVALDVRRFLMIDSRPWFITAATRARGVVVCE